MTGFRREGRISFTEKEGSDFNALHGVWRGWVYPHLKEGYLTVYHQASGLFVATSRRITTVVYRGLSGGPGLLGVMYVPQYRPCGIVFYRRNKSYFKTGAGAFQSGHLLICLFPYAQTSQTPLAGALPPFISPLFSTAHWSTKHLLATPPCRSHRMAWVSISACHEIDPPSCYSPSSHGPGHRWCCRP